MPESPLVGIVIASESDLPVMEQAAAVLDQLEIPYELILTSAHRSPRRTRKYVQEAAAKGIEVIIAGAGGAAHLPGVLAAETGLPIIGVPIDSTALSGLDALLSIVQMPGGVPVATMAVGRAGARNSGIFSAQILALKYPKIADRLAVYKANLEAEVLEKAKRVDGKAFKNRSKKPGFKPSSAGGESDTRG